MVELGVDRQFFCGNESPSLQVATLKTRIHEACHEYGAHRQKLVAMCSELPESSVDAAASSDGFVVLEDARTIESYGLRDESELNLWLGPNNSKFTPVQMMCVYSCSIFILFRF